VTLGDADFRKSLMKMIYRMLSKTASSSVTCHPLRIYGISLCGWDGEPNSAARFLVDYGVGGIAT